jgi:hypothetical protein
MINHSEILTVIEKLRFPEVLPEHRPCACHERVDDRNAHCDDLRTTAVRHGTQTPEYTEPNGGATVTECEHCGLYWPCDDYQQVLDRLAIMSANVDKEEDDVWM